MSRPVAAFDFDGTITESDTLVPFLALVAGWPKVVGAAVRHAPSFRDRDRAKERVLRTVLAGREEAALRQLGREYASELPNRFRPELLDRIDWHRREGHELVIVSASLRYYLDHVADALSIGTVIAVEMEVADGRLTGELARPNVRGPEKARRLQEWWGDRPATELWAYGNSSGDEALLALADHPTWIGRS